MAGVRRLLRDTAIVLAVSLGMMVALELVLRGFAPQSLRGTPVRGEHLSIADPLLGLRYVPGSVWRFRHPEYDVEYAINPEGFRDARRRPPRGPPGTTRVLLLGDSFTFGQGVSYQDAWPVQAERWLDRTHPGQFDLVKAGLQGMDTRSELILLRRLAARYPPDAVVVSFLINDVYTNSPLTPAARHAADSARSWEDVRGAVFRPAAEDRTFHLLALARRLVTSVDRAYVGLYLAVPARGDFLRTPLPPLPRRQLAVTEELLAEMDAVCDSLGVPLVVLSIPQQFQVLYLRGGARDPGVDVRLYDRRLEALAARRGFEWIATLDAFAAADTGGAELYYRLDGHLTAAGNQVVAERFVEEVVPRIVRGGRAPGLSD